MATVHNPTPFDSFCHAAGKSIPPGGEITVSDEVAERVSTVVFIVTPEEPKAAVRKTAKRGGQVAEVTEAPLRETR